MGYFKPRQNQMEIQGNDLKVLFAVMVSLIGIFLNNQFFGYIKEPRSNGRLGKHGYKI